MLYNASHDIWQNTVVFINGDTVTFPNGQKGTVANLETSGWTFTQFTYIQTQEG